MALGLRTMRLSMGMPGRSLPTKMSRASFRPSFRLASASVLCATLVRRMNTALGFLSMKECGVKYGCRAAMARDARAALPHFTLDWLLFPLRYLDLPLLRTSRAGRIGNHCYLWLRKPE